MANRNKQQALTSSIAKTTDISMNFNLESFACLWLDQNINSTEDNIQTQKELRQVINHLRTFDNSDECEQYINQIEKEKIVLIVSGSLGYNLVPRLHDLPQFYACYVYCQDQKRNQQWAKKYHKVLGVFVDLSKLIAQISQDQKTRSKLEDGANISVIAGGSLALQARNAIFMWFQLFVEVLLRMHHKLNDRKELLDICKTSYNGNSKEMEIINEFEKRYTAENAIWWYTRESCFYRMMNKALRVQDFHMLFVFRFFITDIARQIKSEHEKFIRTSDNRNIIRVYRGQMIENDELELIKKNVGEYLSMNSFLSTSRNRSTGLYFAQLGGQAPGLHRILLEIEINPRLQTKAYAEISQMSFFQAEDEVLIMLGALFCIEEINEDENGGVWVARVSLASEDDFQLKETFSYMKSTIGEDTDLNSLGEILIQMGEYEQARKCYSRMLRDAQLMSGYANLNLGRIGVACGEDGGTLEYLKEALHVRKHFLGEEHVDVGECYNRIGTFYWYLQKNYDQALLNFQKALEIQEAALPASSLALAITYNNLACVNQSIGQYDSSLQYFQKCLKVEQQLLPSNHHGIALTYNNIGFAYESKGDYVKALEYYEKSIEISRKTLPPNHSDTARTEKNIEQVKIKMKN